MADESVRDRAVGVLGVGKLRQLEAADLCVVDLAQLDWLVLVAKQAASAACAKGLMQCVACKSERTICHTRTLKRALFALQEAHK